MRAVEERSDVIILVVPSTKSSKISVCKQLKENKDTQPIPIITVVLNSHSKGEKSWFKLGVEDIINISDDPEALFFRLKNRIDSCVAVQRRQNQTISLEKKLRQKTNELTRTQAEIVQRLSMAAEHRDPETGNHIHRMSHYCYCIALAFGISEKESRLLLNASPMHDIGKLGIPDSVLLNPESLTPDEWVIMRKHAEIGERILEGSESKLVQLGQIVAGTHHEKWDGTGYPNQLSKETIPIWGRIAALADVFDAMTTKRVYQNPVPVSKAFAYIKQQKGKHFDPELAELFLSIKQELLDIRKKFPN